jgi:hypothetical protein
MYTIRDLVNQAYRDSNVIGIGQTPSAEEMDDGTRQVNSLLNRQWQQGGFATTTIALDAAFDGRDVYSIGPMPDLIVNPTAEVPDFVVDVAPTLLNGIILYSGNNARLPARPITSGQYFTRGVSVVQNTYPDQFYYERRSPLAYIRWYMGAPQGPGQIIYEPSYVGVSANTDISSWNLGLQDYLKWSLAANIAALNRFDATWLQQQAQIALAEFKRANYKGQSYTADFSAGGKAIGGTKFNIYTGELV